MGCDIHWYSETKRDGQWRADQESTYDPAADADEDYEGFPDMEDFPNRDRDYWFFGLLNGVRTRWPWSFDIQHAERVPENASEPVQALAAYWEADAHSHGVLTRQQLKEKIEELKELRSIYLIDPPGLKYVEALNHCLSRLDQCIKDLNADVPDSDQRIIFWFDN